MEGPEATRPGSSRKALRIAWAAAQERTGEVHPQVTVNSWDLLVGVVLAGPGESEAAQAFRAFGLVAGQVLPGDYPQLTAVGLDRRLTALPADAEPLLDPETASLVDAARRINGVSEARADVVAAALWTTLLEWTGGAADQVHALLRQRGVEAGQLAEATRGWLASGGAEPYQTILTRFSTTPVDVINYKADQTGRDAATRDAPPDFVGIGAEVDAFAYLIASRSLQPPLAVGLFGDWGSGKSYFLDAIRRRIDLLTAPDALDGRPQRELPFWKRVVQVEFNAWHYVEGDLWSSLVDHIFTQLNLASEGLTDDEVQRRQRYILRQLDTTAEAMRRLEAQRKATRRKLRRRRRRVATLRKRQNVALAALRDTRAEKLTAAAITSSRQAVLDAVTPIGITVGAVKDGDEPLTIGGALDSLAAARAEVARGRSLLRPLLDNPNLMRWLSLFVAGAAIVTFLLWYFKPPGIAASFAGLATFCAAVVPILRAGTTWVKTRLDAIERADRAVDQELVDTETAWRVRIVEAERQVQETTGELDAVSREAADLERQATEAREALAKPPPEILYDFLRERLAAADYRQRLGVPALIRRDFKGLADLIRHQNDYLLEPDTDKRATIRAAAGKDLLPEDDNLIINRIVLYIDDLDRCPDEKVVEVLQAVHLLLAFPLFVVVVAVDSRWLAHALQRHYPALAGAGAGNGAAGAAPDDYLEKIFQVPFWVQGLPSASRSRIVRGLLQAHLRGEGDADAGDVPGQEGLADEEAQALATMIAPRSAPPLLATAALTVTREELAALDRLAPLMGRTPRSVKRFVNVYQLLKILRHGRPPFAAGGPTDDELAAFLLAIAESMPKLGWRLFDEVAEHPDLTLGNLIDGPAFAANGPERLRLRRWLDDPPNLGWDAVAGRRLDTAAADVRRFLFRLIPAAG